MKSAAARLSTSLLAMLLAGCANLPQGRISPSRSVLRGTVRGGQQPIKGAAVQLYAVSATGDGSPATALLSSSPLTDVQGGFSLPVFTCPSLNTPVYLVASGGDPGTGKNNPALALMTALGPCGELQSIPYVAVNEVTTVASIFPIAPFMVSYSSTGSTVQHSPVLASDFAAVNAFVDITTGKSPGPAFGAGLTVPVAEVYTLADVFPSGNVGDSCHSKRGEAGHLLSEYLLNEGTGTVAHDTSGRGNDGTISGAGWEGTSGLNFDHQSEYIQMPSAINAAKTFQIAAYFPVFGNAVLPQAPGYGVPSAFGSNPSLLCGTDASQLCLISSSIYGTDSFRFLAYTTDSTEAALPISPGWHVFTLICGSNLGGVLSKTHYLYDGAEVSGYIKQGSTGTCPTPAGGNYQIGGSSLLYDSWFVGKVGAAWTWSVPLTVSEGAAAATSALNFLQSKGVVTSFTDAANPLPVLIGGFDSRTNGAVDPSKVWLRTMSLSDSSYTRINLGEPGQLAYDACNQFELTYGEQIPTSSTRSAITVLWRGVNDFLFTGQTPQQVADSLQCMVRKAKAAGSLVILATEISFVNQNYYSLSGDADKGALDTIIRMNAFSWGADNIADLATDSHVGADGASTNPACFVDGVHPGESCEVYITAIMQDAVNELLGSTAKHPTTTAASAYQEQAGDDYLTLTGASVQSVTLPSCIGYSLDRTVANAGTSTANLMSIGGETLTGNANISSGATATISPFPGPTSTGGCTWTRTK